MEKGAQLFFAKDDAGMKKHMEETVPRVFGQLERRLISRGGQFFVGNTLSWADIHLYAYCAELPDQAVMTKFPKLKNLVDRVKVLPRIQAWVG